MSLKIEEGVEKLDKIIACEECNSSKVYTKTKNNKTGKILCSKCYTREMYFGGKTRTRYTPNEIIIHDDYAEIKLYDINGNYRDSAYIDIEDVDAIKPYKWYLDHEGYVRATINKKR